MRKDWVVTSAQYSLASSLAIPASTSLRSPESFSRAARTISAWAASTLVAISASWKAIAWGWAMGLPNVSRCWAYWMASSKARITAPQARAARLTRTAAAARGGTVYAAHLCAAHHLRESLARHPAEDVVGRGLVAVEHQLGGVDALVAHLVDLAGDGEGGLDLTEARRLLDQEGREVLVRLLGALVGAHQGRDQRRAAAVGQPHLLAVDDVVAVGLFRGLGADARDVGPQPGLRHGEGAAHLAGGHPRQEALLLLLGAVLDDHVGDDEVGVDDAGDAHPAAGDLLHHQRVGQQRLAEAAVLLGNGEPEDPELLEPVDDLLRIDVAVLELLRLRDDLLVDEAPDRRQDLLLDVGQVRGLCKAGHRSPPGTPVSVVAKQYGARPRGVPRVPRHRAPRPGSSVPRVSTGDDHLYQGDPSPPPGYGPPGYGPPGYGPPGYPPPGYGPPGYPPPGYG